MTSAFSWQNSVSLCSASFCVPKANLPVTPGVSWLPPFAFQSPIMKRTSFLGVSLEGLVDLHRTIQLQFLQHYWLGHRLGLLWYWIVFLGNKQRSFCHFFFFFAKQILFYFFFKLYITVLVLPNIKMNPPQVYMCSFLRLHPSSAFRTLVDHNGYSISSKGFLPAVVDIMVIWVKFTHPSPFEFADS